jgi:hypothetical protein
MAVEGMKRSLTMLVLALALFIRAWVPTGWMPAASGGFFAIEPCAAASPMPLSHALHHGPSHKAQHEGDCAFAPLHAEMAPADEAGALVDAVAVAGPAPQAPLRHFLQTGPPSPPPPATGPPILA